MVRSWLLVAVGGLLLACLLCLGLLTHFSDAATLREERRQQEMLASFTARSLDLRIETYQRVLQSMGQGIHSSMLDTPYLLELLLREDAGYAGIFDTLVMTGSDGSMVSYAPSGGTPVGGSALRDALRRTLSDGKPQVTQAPNEGAAPQLGLLLTVPLRNTDGSVRGALAGVVRMGLSSLLPQAVGTDESGAEAGRMMLVDKDGNLLAHSTPDRLLGTVWHELRATEAQWAGLSSTSTPNADTQQWDALLVTRVGMPLPRWQVVAVRDLSPRMLGMQRLTPWQWAALVATAVTVALALLALLWWISRPLRALLRQRRQRAFVATVPPGLVSADEAHAGVDSVPSSLLPVEPDEAAYIREQWQALEGELRRSQEQGSGLESLVIQLLEALPSGAVWECQGVLRYVSRRAAALLEREGKPLQGAPLHQLLCDQPSARQWMEWGTVSMVSYGHCRGEVPWRLRPGLVRWLHVEGQRLHPPAEGNLWLLEDAEGLRQRRRQSRWQDTHDATTQLPDRYTLLAQLQAWCAQPPSPQPALGLMWLDVDYFTAFNATAGRAAGDEVLRQVAWLLQREQGTQGMAARVGADAFVLWLPASESQAAVQTLAWRLCTAVQDWVPRYAGQRFALGLSVGWLWTDAGALDAEQLLRTVESACREAKRTGQGRAVQGLLPDVYPQ